MPDTAVETLVMMYVDPTGGGLLLQVLLGGSAGVLVIVRLFGRAIAQRLPRRWMGHGK